VSDRATKLFLTSGALLGVLAFATSTPASGQGVTGNMAKGEVRSDAPTRIVVQGEAAPQPLVLTVSNEKPLRIENVGGGGTPAWVPALITGIGAVITSLVALGASLLAVHRANRQSAQNTKDALQTAAQNTHAAIQQKSNELEIAWIETRLSSFFGPFMQLSEENKRLAALLRGRQSDGDFRTLKALLDPSWKNNASQTDARGC